MNVIPKTIAPSPDVELPTLTLWDWRRRISDLYSTVRATEDARAAWQLWRDTRADLFGFHPQTPLDPGSALPNYFEYDPGFRFAVSLADAPSGEPFFLSAGGDGSVRLTPFAETRGLKDALGAELLLYWIGGYGGGVFLPFLDATTGEETYAGGRYLLDTIKSADLGALPDGRIILDFNFAYNPSCSYSARWVCPLAPRVNRLPTRIAAGERL